MQSGSSPYFIKMEENLLHQLFIHGVSPDDAIFFFTEQVEKMIGVEPNLKQGRTRSRSRHNRQHKDAWVTRGYVPNTHVFFKITLMRTKDVSNMEWLSSEYYAKVSAPPPKHRGWLQFDGAMLRPHYLERKMEIEVFGTSAHKPVIELLETKYKKPKCMAPKGVKLSKLKEKK